MLAARTGVLRSYFYPAKQPGTERRRGGKIASLPAFIDYAYQQAVFEQDRLPPES
jgi:hypothetical protein